jgi:DNA-binding NtrC family response regulator
VPANIRIVAATNTDLLANVQAHRFREDLYFRLNILSLTIPPLRERLDDVPVLVAHYVREYARLHTKPVAAVEAAALESLMAYHWPGNVRELQTVLQRAVLTAKGGSVSSADVDLPARPTGPKGYLTLKAAKLVAITQCERGYLSSVLQRCGGNITQAARMAGKERRSFQRLLRKYSITVIPFKRGHEVT